MNNSIQAKFDIVATDYDFFDDVEPTIIVETSEHRFYIQTVSGKYGRDCWMTTDDSDGDINWDDYAEVYGEDSDDVLSTIIEVAEVKAKRILKEKTIERIVDEDESGEIQAKAAKIAAMVGGDADDYLILSNTMSNADSTDINNAMIFLQVNLGCTQAQSNEIVNLFR